MSERLGAPGIDRRLRPGYEPLTIESSLLEFAPEHITHKVFNFGSRIDGSTQWVTLFGSQSHGVATMLQPTMQAWEDIELRTGRNNLHRLKLFVEGRVRFPDIQLSDETIFKNSGGETALFEALARRAGVIDVQAPEPPTSVLSDFINEYGATTVNDYLYLRKYWEWSRIPEDNRPNFSVYVHDTMPKEYSRMLIELPDDDIPDGLSILGALRRLRRQYPEFPQKGAVPVDNRLLAILDSELFHVPILQRTQPDDRSDIQNLVVDFNFERDVSFMNAIMDAIKEERDVAFIAGGPHLRAIIPPLMILQREYQRKRSRKGLIYDVLKGN